jgi:hypothetical protein
MPRLRQFLLTLSMAMYPRLDRLRCMLCLQTITPIGSELAGSVGYACGHGAIGIDNGRRETDPHEKR